MIDERQCFAMYTSLLHRPFNWRTCRSRQSPFGAEKRWYRCFSCLPINMSIVMNVTFALRSPHDSSNFRYLAARRKQRRRTSRKTRRPDTTCAEKCTACTFITINCIIESSRARRSSLCAPFMRTPPSATFIAKVWQMSFNEDFITIAITRNYDGTRAPIEFDRCV